MDSMDKQPSIKAFKVYLDYWKGEKFLTFLSFMFSLTVGIQNTVVPLMVAVVLGQLIHTHNINVGLIVFTGIFQVVVIIAAYVFDRWGIAQLHYRVDLKLYDDAFEYLVNQDYSFFADRFSGSLVTMASRFTKVYTIFNDVLFFDLLPQLFFVLISVGIMSYYSIWLGVIVFVMWLIIMTLVVKLGIGRMPIRRAAVAVESKQVGELADVITNSLTVKTFASEYRERERYKVINILRGQSFLVAWRKAVRNVWTIEGLCVILQMFVFVGGIYAVKYNGLGIATFLLFQVYIVRIIDTVRKSNMIVRQLELVAGDAQEMTELFEMPPLIQDKPSPAKSTIQKGEIKFSDVSFRYEDSSGNQNKLFEGLDIAIKPGEKIGLVGPSGGGKTTITRLLLRFMDIQDGSISIDGKDIRDIKQQDLRTAMAYVPQEPLLFHRSIKDNIRYGKPDATDNEVRKVAKDSFANEFIDKLPDEYDTTVGERGVKLSGGQRQRIAIARAMLKNAPILILDEATSALDSESERVIQKALWTLMRDKTAVVIAHRLSTIQRLDRIIVLDEGKIVEQGTHKQLIEANGLYAKLWSHQSGGFIEE